MDVVVFCGRMIHYKACIAHASTQSWHLGVGVLWGPAWRVWQAMPGGLFRQPEVDVVVISIPQTLVVCGDHLRRPTRARADVTGVPAEL